MKIMKNKAMVSIITSFVIAILFIGFLVMRTYANASTTFTDDGYILTTVQEQTAEDSVNVQHYFNKGESFREKYPGQIVFKNTDGNKVAADTHSFVHYQSGSMSGMTSTVLMDTNTLDDAQISYYAVSNKSLLEKSGEEYHINNAGENISLEDFVWKISDTQYMVVSPEINLHVTEDTARTFTDYVEVLYQEGGIVYFVNHEGTYSTVSSEAYLQLSNGICFYPGSKNISDGEAVLVNLTQMVVDSDDNIEIIPDEEYKKENVDQPTINVEASDGEDGEDGEDAPPAENGDEGKPGDPGEPGQAGELGTNGKNGSNGSNGSTGSSGAAGVQGAPGQDGNGDENGNVIFQPETMPIYTADIATTPYGMTANLALDSNGCSIYSAEASVVDSLTGALVWKTPLNGDAAETIHTNTLKQNRDYVLKITADYVSGAGTTGTREVFSKLFHTDIYGLTLEYKYASENMVVLDLLKADEVGITNVTVNCYDENLVMLSSTPFGILAEGDHGIQQDMNNGGFYIRDVAVGERLEIRFPNLERNKPYYMQIVVNGIEDASGTIQGTLVPSNAFEPQRFMTLKKAPVIGEPIVQESVKTNSFIIRPSSIEDVDGGIEEMIYKVYEADSVVVANGLVTSGVLAYKAEKASFDSVNVPVGPDGLAKNKTYVAYIEAKFSDNHAIAIYGSPLSEPFAVGNSSWPGISHQYDGYSITASTAEGKILLHDESRIIDVESVANPIKVVCTSNTMVDGKIIERTIPIADTVIENGKTNQLGIYEIPYSLKGLKAGVNYTMTVYASRIYMNDRISEDVVIGNATFTTKEKYEPLLLAGGDARSNDKTHSFNAELWFAPADKDREEAAARVGTQILGLENMGDLSAKSMTYVSLSLYKGKADGSGPDLVNGRLGSTLLTYNIFVDMESYRFDNPFYKEAYSNSTTVIPSSGKPILLNESDFNVDNSIFAKLQGQTVYIKVETIKDYTFGRGGSSAEYNDGNIIPVGTQANQSDFAGVSSDQDAYIPVSVNAVIPPFPQEMGEIRIINKGIATQMITSDPNYYKTDYSNYNSAILQTDLWKNTNSISGVAIEFTGTNEMLPFASAVTYKLIRTNNGTEEEVASVTFDVADDANSMPTWTYFLNVEDPVTGKALARGDKFKIQTEVELRYIKDDQGRNMIYPNEFRDDDEVLDVGPDTYIEKTDLFIEKEIPTVDLIQWAGDTDSGKVETLYIRVKDIDKALVYNGGDKLSFYSGKDILTALPDELADIGDAENPFQKAGFKQLQFNAANILNVQYVLVNGGEMSKITLTSEEKIKKGENIYILQNDGVINEYTVVDVSGNPDINFTVPIKVSNYEKIGKLETEFWIQGNESDKVTININENDITWSEVTDQDGKPLHYLADFTVKGEQLISLAGSAQINYRINVYYDTGRYGLQYVLESTGAGANPYYAVQEQQDYVSGKLNGAVYNSISNPAYSITNNNVTVSGSAGDALTSIFDSAYLGLQFLPKQLASSSHEGTLALPYVIPEISVTVKTSVVSATVTTYVNSRHMLDTAKDKNVFIRYWESGTSAADATTQEFKITDAAKYNEILSNLKANTTYFYDMWGWFEGEAEAVQIKAVASFKTNPKISSSVDTSKTAIVSNKQNINDKMLHIPFTIANFLKGDAETLAGIDVAVYPKAAGTTGTPVEKYTFTADYIKEQVKNWQADEAKSLSLTAEFTWSPATKHIIGDGNDYIIQFTARYSNGHSDKSQTTWETVKFSEMSSYKSMWPSFVALGTLYKDGYDEDSIELEYVITGSDAGRILLGTASNNVVYKVTLLDKSDNVVCVKDNITVFVDENGNFSPTTATFTPADGIQLGKEYHLEITAENDLNNDGQKETNQFVYSGSSDDLGLFKMPGTLEPEITAVAEMINDGAGKSFLYIWGNNLEYTDKAMYTVTAVGGSSSTSLSATYTGSTLASNFINLGGYNGPVKYKLNIRDDLSTTGIYTITASLFTDDKSATTTVTYGMVN